MGPTAVSWISFVIRRRVFRSFDRARNPTLSSAIESTENGSLGRRTLTHICPETRTRLARDQISTLLPCSSDRGCHLSRSADRSYGERTPPTPHTRSAPYVRGSGKNMRR